VGEQQVWSEHAEMVEMHDGPAPTPCQVALRVGRRGGQVHRHRRAELAREVGGTGEQRVRGEIVADERDPPLDQAAGGKELDHRALAIEHLVARRRVRPDLDVPAPRADRPPQPGRQHTGRHPFGVGDRSGLDHRRHTVAQRLDRAQRRRQLVVVTRVGAV
jgi:hypothetical protein